jgi:hypothetical protein
MKVTELRECDHGIVIILDDRLEVFLGWAELNLNSHKNSLVRLVTGRTATDYYHDFLDKSSLGTSLGKKRSCRF